MGYTSGRAKLSITSPDPDYQIKRQRLDDLKKGAKGTLSQADSRFYVGQVDVTPKKALLVMMDETDIHLLCPDLKTKGLVSRISAR